MAKRKGFMMYNELAEAIVKMPAEQVKQLLLDMWSYAETGRAPDYSADYALDMIWGLCRARLDADAERYDQIVQRRKEAAGKRWEQSAQAEKKSVEPPVHRSKYRPGPIGVSTAEMMDKYINF